MTRQAAGAALTDRMLEAIMPLLDGQNTELGIEALAAAFVVVLQVAGTDDAGRALVIRRYKAALDSFMPEDRAHGR